MKTRFAPCGRMFVLCLSLLLLLSALAGCSDQVLNPDGTIGTAGGKGTSVLELNTDPIQTPDGDSTLRLETESTAPIISIDDPDGDPYAQDPHAMYVDFLNTGSSDAILLRMDGKVILVDTGESDDATTIRNTLKKYGITTIDILIITHYDNDHIGAAVSVLDAYPVGTVYMPDYIRSSSLYRKLTEKLDALTGTEIRRLYNEHVDLDLGYGKLWINATALAGYEAGVTVGSDENNPDTEENNFSLITSVTFGNVSLLLAGDAERLRMEEFNALAAERGIVKYSLIKIPHHGVSADKELLSALDRFLPRYCVVCTDSASSVDKSLETKMKAVGAGRYYTCDGTVLFSTNGSTMTVRQE